MKDDHSDIQIIEVTDNSVLVDDARKLLTEYGNYMYSELGLIAGKESFFKELQHFPGPKYRPPSGVFVVATINDIAAGCVGVKKFDDSSCEMKRMYVSKVSRGKGIGKLLCNFVIEWCERAGYKNILLDTNTEMAEAVSLYLQCGFYTTPPYCVNENEHPVFMKYEL